MKTKNKDMTEAQRREKERKKSWKKLVTRMKDLAKFERRSRKCGSNIIVR